MKISNHKIAGCDEAGRGAAAGPVVAAAVVLPQDSGLIQQIKDSKQLTPRERIRLRHIIESNALAWAVGEASVREIDQINILQATFLAMHRAIAQLTKKNPIQHLLIDGNRFKPYQTISHTCIVKGDQHIPSIAAASILAKTHRDNIMETLDIQYPQYCWKNNKGYPTRQHKRVIAAEGITPFHRTSYKPCQVPSIPLLKNY